MKRKDIDTLLTNTLRNAFADGWELVIARNSTGSSFSSWWFTLRSKWTDNLRVIFLRGEHSTYGYTYSLVVGNPEAGYEIGDTPDLDKVEPIEKVEFVSLSDDWFVSPGEAKAGHFKHMARYASAPGADEFRVPLTDASRKIAASLLRKSKSGTGRVSADKIQGIRFRSGMDGNWPVPPQIHIDFIGSGTYDGICLARNIVMPGHRED